MAETNVVCGHGFGISDAVARRFGKEGYRVAAPAECHGSQLMGAVQTALVKGTAFDTGNATLEPSVIAGMLDLSQARSRVSATI